MRAYTPRVITGCPEETRLFSFDRLSAPSITRRRSNGSDGRSGDDDPYSLPFLRESRGGLTRFMGVRYHAWHTPEALLWAAVILLMLLAPLPSIPR